MTIDKKLIDQGRKTVSWAALLNVVPRRSNRFYGAEEAAPESLCPASPARPARGGEEGEKDHPWRQPYQTMRTPLPKEQIGAPTTSTTKRGHF
jgi:hypothetical protein